MHTMEHPPPGKLTLLSYPSNLDSYLGPPSAAAYLVVTAGSNDVVAFIKLFYTSPNLLANFLVNRPRTYAKVLSGKSYGNASWSPVSHVDC